MGKDRKGKQQRHAPLEAALAQDAQLPSAKRRRRGAKGDEAEEEGAGGDFMSERLSKQIMEQAREQREDIRREEAAASAARPAKDAGLEEEEEEEEEIVFVDEEGAEDLIEVEDGEWITSAGGLSEAEERLIAGFMGDDGAERLTLADIIMEKIREKEEGLQTEAEEDGAPQIPERVVEVYTEIGKVLAHWGRVRIPKAFKVIPHLTNWEEILYLTRPDQWSPHSWFVATRLFASNLNEKMAQHFYSAFLLPKCLEDIADHKRLNYHLYASLQKATYKSAAWVKGILLPLVGETACSLREAAIIGSVLAKTSLPMQHGAAAMVRLSKMQYNGVASLFLRILLQKKYALPHRVIDAVVEHFVSFTTETRQLPVLWHQALLTLVQRYRASITNAQKAQLKQLLRVHNHHLITVEIRRELFAGQPGSQGAVERLRLDGKDAMDV